MARGFGNRTDILHFLGTFAWASGNPEDEPSLTGVLDAGTISPDWDKETAQAGLAQVRCITWLLEGEGQGFFRRGDINVVTRWRNYCLEQDLLTQCWA